MITIGFNLEVDESAKAPSPSEFADALAEALPKEWWADTRCSDWGVTGLFPVKEMSPSEALGLGQALAQKDKKIEKLEAVFSQERKMTAHLERMLDNKRGEIAGLENKLVEFEREVYDQGQQVENLMEKNGNQREIIRQLQSTQSQALVRRYGQRVEDLTKANRNQAAVIQNQQEKISQLNAARRENPNRIEDLKTMVKRLKKRVEYRNGEIERTIKDLDEARKLADARKQTIQTMDTMLFEKDQKLTAAYAEVDELRDRGFTLSDETLTDLEELTTKAKNLVKTASNRATDAFVIIGDINSVLDNIRTER